MLEKREGEKIKEIYRNIYKIEIPLPESSLKALNAYFIRGKERNLLIDTGFDLPACEEAMLSALKTLGAKLQDTDVFLTHAHIDHSGLAYKLKREGNKVLCSEKDGRILNGLTVKSYEQKVEEESALFGIPQELRLVYDEPPEEAGGRCDFKTPFTPLEEGDRLTVGEYNFEVLDLSGHTPGQMGLFDPEKKLLFSGDHILCDITPNIVVWNEEMDSIATFAKNLKKIKSLGVEHVFPGHRDQIGRPEERISQLILHHNNRLKEIQSILKDGEKTVHEIAGRMSWDFAGGNIADFPPLQLWYAVSEAFAHVEHLLRKGIVEKSLKDGRYRYEFIKEEIESAL